MVRTVEEALESANRIGYPVMLKASEGGGGKGIRLSKNDEELRTNFVQASDKGATGQRVLIHYRTSDVHAGARVVHESSSAVLNHLVLMCRVGVLCHRCRTRFRVRPCS
jgi:carbamoylphosphate synthase large subunit